MQTGDIILNANAGLWNFVSDVDLIEHVLKPNWSEPGKIVEATTRYALKTSIDNISVTVVQCSSCSQDSSKFVNKSKFV